MKGKLLRIVVQKNVHIEVGPQIDFLVTIALGK